jgi:3-hydroxyisobutyrate dehydrogenase/2-hydroxy-3-oxopropionate reductase
MQIGFIGLGIMGMPMAKHLIEAGHSLVVWSKTRAKAQSLGQKVAHTPADLARQCDLIFLIVSDTAGVEETATGAGGLLEGVRAGTIVCDCTTIAPSASRALAKRFAMSGAHWMDMPVTGSKAGAEKGTLTFMIGGDKAIFDKVRPYLDPMGKNIYYVGGNGMGLHAKLSQNLVLAMTFEGVCEGLVLAAKAGVPTRLMYDIIQNSAAKVSILEYKSPAIYQGKWDVNFSLKWMHKDIGLMLESGKELGVPLPGLALVQQLFGASIARGHGEDDFASVITLLEDWAGVKVRE